MEVESAGRDADETLVKHAIYRYYDLREALSEPSLRALALDRVHVEGGVMSLSDARARKLDIEMAAGNVDRQLRSEKTLLILCARLYGRRDKSKPNRHGVVREYVHGVPWEDIATLTRRSVSDVKRHFRDAVPKMAGELRRREGCDGIVTRDSELMFTADDIRRWGDLTVAEYADRLRKGMLVPAYQ